MSRIFISHSSRDNVRALELRNWLASNGWDDVFLDVDLSDGLAPGEHWQNALKAAADRCEAVLFLISPNWLSSAWCLSEFLLAKQLGKRLFPLLIDGASLGGLPLEISSDHQAVDLVGDPFGWDRLREGLRRAGLDAHSFPFPKGRRPYPGFEPLTEEDAAIFFGREAQVIRGLDRLRLMRDAGAERMMVVLGASGAGKSSFMRAGFWPRLRRDDRNFLPLPTIRPERAVLSGKSGLFAALEKILSDPRIAACKELAEFPRARASLGSLVVRDGGLAELLASIGRAAKQSFMEGSAPTVVLLIDQAEELLNEEGRTESDQFLEIVARTLDLEKGLIVVLAIRSDAYPQFQNKPGLVAVPREPFDLPPLLEGSLRLVIEGPAKIAVPPLKLEPGLVDALLADSTGQDALPLLAFTLDRLTREYGAEGILTLQNYVSAGGIRGVVTAAVEEALADGRRRGLTPSDPTVLEKLLKQAFIPHLARINEAGEFARRIAYSHEIPELAKPLIHLLVEARLLSRDRDGYGETVEVAHEALLREWPLLRGFLEVDREFLISKRQIADDLKSWEDAPDRKKSDAFLTGLRLIRAQQLLSERSAQDLTDQERTFIGESIKAAESARRRRNAFIGVAIALLVGFSALAATQWVNARHEANIARENKEEAQRSANDFRNARDQAEENAKRAETNEALARSAQVKAQIQESASLADQALRQIDGGDVVDALQTAFSALPHDPKKLERPYVARADFALAKAFLANRLQNVITPSSDWVNDVAYSPDGSRLAVGTRDGYFKLYDTETTREVVSSNDRRSAIMSMAYSEDGSHLITAYQDPPSLIVRDGRSGKSIRTIRLTALPSKVLVNRDGSRAVISFQQGEVRPVVVNLNEDDGNIRALQHHPKLGSFSKSIAISNDQRWLLYVGYGGVFVWDLNTGLLISTSAEADRSVHQFDFKKIEESESIEGGVFLNDRNDAVLIGKRNIYIVNAVTGVIKNNHRFAAEWEVTPDRTPLLSSDGAKIAFALNKRKVATYALSDWRLIATRELPSDVTKVFLSPDGKTLAAVCADLAIRVWPTDSTMLIGTFFGHKDRIRDVTFSPDGARMISYGDPTVRIWDLRDAGDRLSALPSGLQAEAVNFPVTKANVSKLETLEGRNSRGSRPGIWDISRGERLSSDAVAAFIEDGAKRSSFSASGKWAALENHYFKVDDKNVQAKRAKVLEDLRNEIKAEATSVKSTRNDENLDAIAIVDSNSGKAAYAVLAEAGERRPQVAFLGDDGSTLGLVSTEYNGDQSKSLAEVWNAKAGLKLLSISQDGTEPEFHYSDATQCMVFVTRPTWRHYIASLWKVSTGEKVAEFERPLAPELAARSETGVRQNGDRILLGNADIRPLLAGCSTGKEVGSVAGVALGANSLLMSADRRRMLVDSIGAPRVLWNLQEGTKIGMVPDQPFDASFVSFSGDGHLIVSRGRRDQKDSIELFDSETGKLLKAFPEQDVVLEDYVGQFGNRVAVRLGERKIRLLELRSDQTPIQISLNENLHRWRFSASDERLVTVDEAGTLTVWDVHSGKSTFTLTGLDRVEPLGQASLTKNHIPILLAGGGGAILDTIKGEVSWPLTRDTKVTSLELAPDEKSIIVLQSDQISIVALEPLEQLAVMPVQPNEQAFYSYSLDGAQAELYVRSAGGSGTVRLFSIPERKEIEQFPNVRMDVVASDGSLAFVADDKLSFWNRSSGRAERQVQFEKRISSVGFDLAASTVVALTDDQKVWSVDVREGAPKLVGSFRQPPSWIRFAADRTKLVLYEKDNRATLRDTNTGQIVTSFPADWAESSSATRWIQRFDSVRSLIAIRSPDNYVRVYRTSDGAKVTELNWDDNAIADIAFSSDSTRLLIVTEKGKFSNWDVQKSSATPAPSLEREYSSFARVTLKRTPDPSLMIAISARGQVDLYSLNTNSVRTFYAGYPEEDTNAVLSPDGSILAVIGSDDVLRLWHVESGEVLVQLPFKHEYPLTALRFSQDGRTLSVGGRYLTKLFRVPLVGDALLKTVSELIQHVQVSRSYSSPAATKYRLGIFMRDVSQELAQRRQLPVTTGAEVIEVFANSPAQAAGVRVGDIITKVNGKSVGTATESSAAIKDVHYDLALEIIRGTTIMTSRAALPD
jgi:WD40 repeat protein